MDPQFQRVDGRGKADVDWVDYHQTYIALWENRRGCIVVGDIDCDNREAVFNGYMRWYRSWASLYLLKASADPPDTYYQRTPGERRLRDYFLDVEEVVQPYYGGDGEGDLQGVIDKIEELNISIRRDMYITDTRYRDIPYQEVPYCGSSMGASHATYTQADPSILAHSGPSASTYGAPSTYGDPGPSSSAAHPYMSGPILGFQHPYPFIDIQSLGTPTTPASHTTPS